MFAIFWFMLAYSNSIKMSCLKTLYFAIYDRACTLKYDEMFCLFACFVVWFLLCSNFDEMFCLLATDAWFVIWLSVCFNSNEMFWQLICISLSTFCITWKMYFNFDEMFCLFATDACFVIWFNVFRFLFTCSNSESCLHVKIVFDVRWIISF